MLSSIAVDCKWQGTGCSLVVWGTLLHPFLLVKVLMTDVLLEEGKTKFTQIQSCSQSVYGKEANHSQWSFWTLVDHWYITCFFHTWWSCMKLRTDNVTAIYYINWHRNMSPTLLKKTNETLGWWYIPNYCSSDYFPGSLISFPNDLRRFLRLDSRIRLYRDCKKLVMNVPTKASQKFLEGELGLVTSWGPFQPELPCDSADRAESRWKPIFLRASH